MSASPEAIAIRVNASERNHAATASSSSTFETNTATAGDTSPLAATRGSLSPIAIGS
jgi:hypothetical protein